ncbi:MAG: hypothetical protein KAT41_07600 [Candidatus Marinimicrobia bacterium]|nr:hypothetical protein [Candidatus Neomarinimicrobiota bacterium]
MFSAGAINAEADRLVQEVNVVGSQAAAYYRKPASMGGGARSFAALAATANLPLIGAKDSTETTLLTITSAGDATSFGIKAASITETDVYVTATINKDGVSGSPTITKP